MLVACVSLTLGTVLTVLCMFRMDVGAIGHAIIIPMQGGTGPIERFQNQTWNYIIQGLVTPRTTSPT